MPTGWLATFYAGYLTREASRRNIGEEALTGTNTQWNNTEYYLQVMNQSAQKLANEMMDWIEMRKDELSGGLVHYYWDVSLYCEMQLHQSIVEKVVTKRELLLAWETHVLAPFDSCKASTPGEFVDLITRIRKGENTGFEFMDDMVAELGEAWNDGSRLYSQNIGPNTERRS